MFDFTGSGSPITLPFSGGPWLFRSNANVEVWIQHAQYQAAAGDRRVRLRVGDEVTVGIARGRHVDRFGTDQAERDRIMTGAERAKLAGIEAGATADQSAAEIRAALGIQQGSFRLTKGSGWQRVNFARRFPGTPWVAFSRSGVDHVYPFIRNLNAASFEVQQQPSAITMKYLAFPP